MKSDRRALAEWVQTVEELIANNTTPARTRGRYKGHGSTDSVAAFTELVKLVELDIRRRAKGSRAYDENMSMASMLGVICASWYALVHRAKSMDPNRPLAHRRRAAKQLLDYKGRLAKAVNDDKTMCKVWGGQEFNMPWGKGAKGGRFV